MSKVGADQKFLEDLKRIVNQACEEPDFSIDLLCREMALSRSQLHRKIKTATGLSTTLFIRRCRLEKAKEMLLHSELNISEVAYQVGISSPQNFSKYFTEAYGVSPTAFRKSPQAAVGCETPVQQSEPGQSVADSGPVGRNIKWIAQYKAALFPLLSIAVFGLAIWFVQRNASPEFSEINPTRLPTSLALLPFNNSGQEVDLYFSRGIWEDIMAVLGSVPEIKVISKSTAEKYEDTEKPISQIAEELHVAYVVTGNLQQSEQHIIIELQLEETASGKLIWAKRFDRSLEEVLILQREIAVEITETLGFEADSRYFKSPDPLPPLKMEAYNAALKGRFLMRNRIKEGLIESMYQFDRAIQIDSNSSDAYAGKAGAAFLLANIYYKGKTEEREYLEKTEQNALLAIKNNVHNAKAYAMLANVYRQEFRWQESLTSYEIALQINPNDALINYWYALNLRQIGRLEDALQHHQLASELDPLHPVINAGYIYTTILAGHQERARDLIAEGEVLFKNSFLHQFVKGHLLLVQEQYQDALTAFEVSLSINPDFSTCRHSIVYCYGKLGKEDLVREYLKDLDITQASDLFRSAIAHLSLGEQDLAIANLQLAAAKGQLPEDILADTFYKEILEEPEVLKLLKQFGLAEYLSSALQH